MNRTSQTEELTKIWVEAQQKMWTQWFELAQKSPATDIFDQWQAAFSGNLDSWMADADDTTRETAERMLASQKAMMQFWQFAAKAWQDISAQMDSGGDWQQALRNYTEQIRKRLDQSAQTAFQSGAGSNELWTMYQEQMQKLMRPWMEWWQNSPSIFNEAISGKNVGLPEWGKLYHTIYQETISPFLTSPTMGFTRQLEHKLRKGFVVWEEYRQADFNYQMVVFDAWAKTFEYIQQKLLSLSEQDQKITSLEELGTLWIDAAENAFGEVFASNAYIEAQGTLVNATMRYRIYQREVMELVFQMVDIPTRREVDAAHRTNYELRKEIKALKKQLEAIQPTENGVAEEVADLKSEVEKLKKAVAEAAKPKRTTRRRTTKSTGKSSQKTNTKADKGES
jgi:class III poly(R)-hydroxyalkanoic acid synthase PhaE subunit